MNRPLKELDTILSKREKESNTKEKESKIGIIWSRDNQPPPCARGIDSGS